MNSLFHRCVSVSHRLVPTSCCLDQTRNFSKYLSRAGKKRLVLNTKRAGKGFYKGNGATKEGRLTNKGKFIVERWRQLELVVPDLTDFKLKPYIASTASKFPPEERRNPLPQT